MPNIGAFIAWGLITAIFIPTGWWPNENLAQLVSPMLTYLLPLLIAYTAGHNMYGLRGGVIACIATSGVIVGSNVPMFIGAMIMSPVAAFLIKKFDKAVEGKIRAGFEMLVNNFSVGILGMLLAILGYLLIGGVISSLTDFFACCIVYLKDHSLLPFVSIFIEPAKVMFLNNAINHGILTPLGTHQVAELGKSIIFILESNPGPGFGMLLAYWVFGRGTAREAAPGAILIQFIGGIHEIYYPFVLARPLIVIAPMMGSSACILFLSLLKSGLVAPISPGSVISVILMSPKGETLILLAGVFIAALVSFLVAAPIVRSAAYEDALPENRFTPKYKQKKSEGSLCAVKKDTISFIVFACDAGMGSSALAATRFRKRLEDAGISIRVDNASVSSIPCDADIVVCQGALKGRAENSCPSAEIVTIVNFLQDPALDALFERVSSIGAPKEKLPVLRQENVLLDQHVQSKEEAITLAGRVLYQGGYVQEEYVAAMLEREKVSTTYMGMGIAIPHGTGDAKDKILQSGVSVVQFRDGVDFDGEKAHILIGIAGLGDDHMDILQKVSEALEDEDKLNRIITTDNVNEIIEILNVDTKD